MAVTVEELRKVKELKDKWEPVVKLVAAAIGGAATAIGVLADLFVFGWALVVTGLLGVLFWTLTKWDKVGQRKSQLDPTYLVPRFSKSFRQWSALIGLAVAGAGAGILIYAYREAQIPADVYLYAGNVRAEEDSPSYLRQTFQVESSGRIYDALYASMNSEDQQHHYRIDFAVSKRAKFRWEMVDEVLATVDEYQQLPNDLRPVQSQRYDTLKECLTYRVQLTNPKDNKSKLFPASLVSEDGQYRRVRIEDDLPCNFRLFVSFSQPGIYTWSVSVSLITPSGTNSVSVIKKKALVVVPAPTGADQNQFPELVVPKMPPLIMPKPEASEGK